GRDTIAGAAGAANRHVADLGETVDEPRSQGGFVARDRLARGLADERQAGAQARDADRVVRAALEPVRVLVRLDRVLRIAARAALAPGLERYTRRDVQPAGPRVAEERLVPGEREQVDVRRRHVDGLDADGLRRVHEEPRVAVGALADGRANLRDGLHRPQ